jgi:hypothetical protein
MSEKRKSPTLTPEQKLEIVLTGLRGDRCRTYRQIGRPERLRTGSVARSPPAGANASQGHVGSARVLERVIARRGAVLGC